MLSMVARTTVDGKKLVALRLSKYLSRSALAQKSKVQMGTLQRIEQRGVTGMNFETLLLVAAALDMTPEDLEAALKPTDARLRQAARNPPKKGSDK
jgi:transcriptional regulator with XRE-family HTH domain